MNVFPIEGNVEFLSKFVGFKSAYLICNVLLFTVVFTHLWCSDIIPPELFKTGNVKYLTDMDLIGALKQEDARLSAKEGELQLKKVLTQQTESVEGVNSHLARAIILGSFFATFILIMYVIENGDIMYDAVEYCEQEGVFEMLI
jgi:hypothetical protein